MHLNKWLINRWINDIDFKLFEYFYKIKINTLNMKKTLIFKSNKYIYSPKYNGKFNIT
jgi:hypothetical protein